MAVPPDRHDDPAKRFGTTTNELHRLADWLKACSVSSVAMEATGVYWIPIFEILEEREFEVLLVNAHHVKNVPGRKTDVSDAEWLRELHNVGHLRGSFRPADAVVALRGYMRHRDTLVKSMSTVVQRLQKALTQMNVQLPLVLADITGKTGLAIMHDIVAGRTNPEQLAQHRDPRCRASKREFVTALTGNHRPEHVFVLKQNLELFAMHLSMLADCDAVVETRLKQLVKQGRQSTATLPSPARKPKAWQQRTQFRHLHLTLEQGGGRRHSPKRDRLQRQLEASPTMKPQSPQAMLLNGDTTTSPDSAAAPRCIRSYAHPPRPVPS